LIVAGTPATPSRRLWRLAAAVLLGLVTLLVAGLPDAAGQSPAQQQYKQAVPEPNGRDAQPGGKQGKAGKAGAQKGRDAGKSGKQQQKKKGAGSGEEGKLTFADSDDDGGLSTLAIVLIILTVIAAGALVTVWLRGRQAAG
jgi:hypothetical protein